MAQRFAPTLFFISAGLLIWGADFLFIYVFAALACARGFDDAILFGIGVVPLAVGVATAIASAMTGAVLISAVRGAEQGPSTSRFLQRLTLGLAVLALVAIAWNGLPALLVHRTC
ncbi:MAG: hypothetical protein M3461_10060 [Pseudomonadota bacterium]|nr:hypothetical protein [Pseudomonadota bacterium]